MGDGFWNSEFSSIGSYVTRDLIVPPTNTMVEDIVQSWQAGPNAPVLFQVNVPPDTPPGDTVYIQFNSFGWTPPIPMWPQGNNKWAYKLYGPLNIIGSIGYRYCRNAQCGSADDAQTAGPAAHGHVLTPSLAPQDIFDTVKQWMWPQSSTSPQIVAADIPSRGTGFVAGVEYQSYHDPNNLQFNPAALQNIQAIGSNWVVLTPSWTYSLVELFAAHFAAEIAAARRAEVDAAGRDALRFAWAEADEPPGAFYWRLAGPRTLIEMDNTTDGDHVHAVWHDPRNDFGDDLLAAHLDASHGLALGGLR